MSSTSSLRAFLTRAVLVLTTHPCSSWVTHALLRAGKPSTSTTQRPHEPSGVRSGCWQRVGTVKFAFLAASSMVVPSGTSTSTLFILAFIIFVATSYIRALLSRLAPCDLVPKVFQGAGNRQV